jgi:hypothetical protein
MIPQSKPWYESKTIWLSVVAGLLSVAMALQTNDPSVGIFGTIVSVLNVINRLVTSLPIQ